MSVCRIEELRLHVFRLRAIALCADQFEALASEIPSVRESQTIGLIADALRRDLEQLPLIQEERSRGDRILTVTARQSGRAWLPKISELNQAQIHKKSPP